MPKLRNSEFKKLLALGTPKGLKYKMTPGQHRLCRIFEDNEFQASVADFVPRELAALIIYMLDHAEELTEIVEAFQDVMDGTGRETIEDFTGLDRERVQAIYETYTQLVD